MDLGLFEGGGLQAFLDERGVLLPHDERELARSWVGTPVGLYEVAETDPGVGVTLLELRSGLRQVVRERLGSQWLEPGETILARVLPDGDTHQLFGGPLNVPLRLRQPLLDLLDSDPDVEQLAAWFGAAQQPPAVVQPATAARSAAMASRSGILRSRTEAALDHRADPAAVGTLARTLQRALKLSSERPW